MQFVDDCFFADRIEVDVYVIENNTLIGLIILMTFIEIKKISMKKKLQKISIAVAAIVLFIGVMLLSIEKNDQVQWKVATVSSFAQGKERGTIEVANYENIRTVNPIAIYNYCSSTLLPYRCFKDETGLFSI